MQSSWQNYIFYQKAISYFIIYMGDFSPTPNYFRLFDVKSVSYRSKKAKFRPGTKINRMLTLEQKRLKVEFLFVDKEGKCTIKPR